ncbi:putative autophagy-related protein 7 atg7 [Cardiosporidium cionae]|uniref:Autophagy-related protein 7 atg7 n=1 Tax=Cardiosporidium cionae TaxID=476202 RepID=A0ABQ7JE79_9APIC|nr:putative autophagy-related protein 7 atg7 [Cardiosporidium cionae]|eukprot:KAF8822301.1 putative autophagy-related protein 7 atg7 [Cardiosporidium cionae]
MSKLMANQKELPPSAAASDSISSLASISHTTRQTPLVSLLGTSNGLLPTSVVDVPPLLFLPFKCTIAVQFWQGLGNKKLNDWKLSTPWVPVKGTYRSCTASDSPALIRIALSKGESNLQGITTASTDVNKITQSNVPLDSNLVVSNAGDSSNVQLISREIAFCTKQKEEDPIPYSVHPLQAERSCQDGLSNTNLEKQKVVVTPIELLESSRESQLDGEKSISSTFYMDSPAKGIAASVYDTSVHLDGFMINVNSIPEFKQFDRPLALQQLLQSSFMDSFGVSVSTKSDDKSLSSSESCHSEKCTEHGSIIPSFTSVSHDKLVNLLELLNDRHSQISEMSPLMDETIFTSLDTVAINSRKPLQPAPLSWWMRQLNQFFLLSYMNLKTYKIVYSVAFPALQPAGKFFSLIQPPLPLKKNNKQCNRAIAAAIDEKLHNLSLEISASNKENQNFVQNGVFWLLETPFLELVEKNTNVVPRSIPSSAVELQSSSLPIEADSFLPLDHQAKSVDPSQQHSLKLFPIESFPQLVENLGHLSSTYCETSSCTIDPKHNPRTKTHGAGYTRSPSPIFEASFPPSSVVSKEEEHVSTTPLPEKEKISCDTSEMYRFSDEERKRATLQNVILCFLDPSSALNALGWCFRNILYILTLRFNLYGHSIKVLAFRDAHYHKRESKDKEFSHFEDLSPVNYAVRSCASARQGHEILETARSVLFHVSIPTLQDFFSSISCLSPDMLSVLRSAACDAFTATGPSSSLLHRILHRLFSFSLVSGWLRHPITQNKGKMAIQNEEKIPRPFTASLTKPLPLSTVFSVNLQEFLSANTMQRNAVDLNVKLIKWRMLPEFKPENMQNLRFLLLGSGALGCNVARCLVGWGVRTITFVDSGRVSMSNPSRQWLYTHSDAEANGGSGMLKVEAAKKNLLEIRPDMECEAVNIEIPMPGHPAITEGSDNFELSYQILESLIDSHDVVYLLTDSRESRWLPALMVAAKQISFDYESAGIQKLPPLCVTVAIGFDSLVVIRHSYLNTALACYFCNDVTAPSDSISNRTLDQQCTVTRPGVSSLASGLAVEMVASLSQHPMRFAAPHSTKIPYSGMASARAATSSFSGNSSTADGLRDSSCLGGTPHTLRAYLADYRVVSVETEPFVNCICCSPTILQSYLTGKSNFVRQVVRDSSILEHISGLHEMKECICEDDVIVMSDEDE